MSNLFKKKCTLSLLLSFRNNSTPKSSMYLRIGIVLEANIYTICFLVLGGFGFLQILNKSQNIILKYAN